jgi:hypothetical protein
MQIAQNPRNRNRRLGTDHVGTDRRVFDCVLMLVSQIYTPATELRFNTARYLDVLILTPSFTQPKRNLGCRGR